MRARRARCGRRTLHAVERQPHALPVVCGIPLPSPGPLRSFGGNQRTLPFVGGSVLYTLLMVATYGERASMFWGRAHRNPARNGVTNDLGPAGQLPVWRIAGHLVATA